jgi:hypothetical protein
VDSNRIEAGRKYLIETEGQVSEMIPRSMAVEQPDTWICVRSGDGKLFTVPSSDFCSEVEPAT